MAATADLRQLLERSRLLASSISHQTDLPPIERNLEQIEAQSRRLASKVTKPGEAPERRAPYFLAGIGIDGEKLTEHVKGIKVLNAFEPREILADTDITSYLEHKYKQTVTSVIADGREQTMRDYQENFERAIRIDWERMKRRVFEELGQYKPSLRSTGIDTASYIGTPYAQRVLTTPGGMTPARATVETPTRTPATISRDRQSVLQRSESRLQVNQRMMLYYDVIRRLNEHRLQKRDFGIINSFYEVAKKIGIESKQRILQGWRALSMIVGEKNVLEGRFQGIPLKERQFTKAYNAHPESKLAAKLREEHVTGARHYLEVEYNEWCQQFIEHYRTEAQLGGVPSVVHTARAFLRAYHRQNGGVPTTSLDMFEGIPLWGLIFNLTRRGKLVEALNVAKSLEKCINKNDLIFLKYFDEYVNHKRLSKTSRDQLMAELKKRDLFKQMEDPYKIVMFYLVAQVKFGNASSLSKSVIRTVEDYLWFKLAIVREPSEGHGRESSYEVYTIRDLQKEIAQDEVSDNVSMSGKDFTECDVEAVHFAIALAYYGLLRVPETQDAVSLFLEKDEQAYLNFNSLMYFYPQRFSQSNPREALQYTILMYLYGDTDSEFGRQQIDISHDYVRQLVYENQAFSELIGSTVLGTEGEIKRFTPLMFLRTEYDFKDKIIKPLARQCENDGRFKAAVSLFELIQDYEMIIVILNKMLGEYIYNKLHKTTFSKEDLEELNPIDIKAIFERYEAQTIISHQAYPNRVQDCRNLIRITDFMLLYENKDYGKAMDLIEEVDVIPLDGDINRVARCANQLSMYDDALKRNIPDIMLMIMQNMHDYYVHLKTTVTSHTLYKNDDAYLKMEHLQRKARNLVHFAGYVNVKVPPNVYSQLNTLEVSMR
ncbi:9126_t:CDS:10 [Paraglomus occultum]|uniref:Nuclear pore protein n=1 Tax=Paraglomus occultum TaxID=144539 RepID=A0A9N9EXX8_9GLOM|nr:9126_t:CDS:10 [Paraglomus occultum]